MVKISGHIPSDIPEETDAGFGIKSQKQLPPAPPAEPVTDAPPPPPPQATAVPPPPPAEEVAQPQSKSLGELAAAMMSSQSEPETSAPEQAAPEAETATETAVEPELETEPAAEPEAETRHGPTQAVIEAAAARGNIVIDMTMTQRSAYNDLVNSVKAQMNTAERNVMLARWHMGAAADKLRRDAAEKNGTNYGGATIDGFASDIGLHRSIVYQAVAIFKALSPKQAELLTVTLESMKNILMLDVRHQKLLVDELVERANNGEQTTSTQVERAVATLKHLSLLPPEKAPDQSLTKVIGNALTWEPEPGKDGKVSDNFGVDEITAIVADTAPALNKELKSAERKAEAEGKSTRKGNDTNSRTSCSHVGVAKKAAKMLENLDGNLGDLIVSLKEVPDASEMTDKATDNFWETAEQILELTESVSEQLKAVKSEVSGALKARQKEIERAEKEEGDEKPKARAKGKRKMKAAAKKRK